MKWETEVDSGVLTTGTKRKVDYVYLFDNIQGSIIVAGTTSRLFEYPQTNMDAQNLQPIAQKGTHSFLIYIAKVNARKKEAWMVLEVLQ